ncbi:hypothetical protein LguiA_013967 [Lonicera macranthoides]
MTMIILILIPIQIFAISAAAYWTKFDVLPSSLSKCYSTGNNLQSSNLPTFP